MGDDNLGGNVFSIDFLQTEEPAIQGEVYGIAIDQEFQPIAACVDVSGDFRGFREVVIDDEDALGDTVNHLPVIGFAEI